MGVTWRAQQRMPRWVLEDDLARLAAEFDPPPVAPDPDEQEQFIDLPWLVA